MASNARNLSKLLGTSTQVPTTALPPAIADLETVGQTLSGGEIAPSSIKSNTLTQSFDSNQAVAFNMADSIDAVSPIVSVFKEVPQPGFSSKGQWDVNANATNYEFFDEKPYSTYASSTLTPSATGDGTFTNSNAIVVGYQMSSTVNLNSTSPSITAQGSGGSWQVVEFDPTGNHVYMVSGTTQSGYAKTVYQYSMSTPHDLSTLNTTPANTLDMSSRVAGTIAHYCPLHITNSGYDLYFGDYQNDIIYQWKMSTAYDLSTASYHGASSAIFVNSMPSLFIQPDGLTGYQVQDGITGSAVLREFTMSTAWDITTASLSGTTSSTLISRTQAVTISPDGTLVIASDAFGSTTSKYFTMSPGYDLSSLSSGTSFTWQGNSSHTTDTRFSSDGALLYGWTGTYIYNYTTGTTAAFNAADVGKKVVGNSGSAIITATSGTYKSVTPFADTSAISSWQLFGAEGKADGSGISLTASAVGSFDISGASDTGRTGEMSPIIKTMAGVYANSNTKGAYMKPDGTQFFIQYGGSQNLGRYIYSIPLTTAYDISTATSTGAVQGNVNTDPNMVQYGGIFFKSDGTSLYFTDTDYTNSAILQYNMSTPWAVNTMSFGTKKLVTNAFLRVPSGIFFSQDGTKMFLSTRNYNISGSGAPHLVRMTLSTPWDLSTAGSSPDTNQTLDMTNLVSTGSAEFVGAGQINSNGTKIVFHNSFVTAPPMFVKLELSTAYDLTTATVTENTPAGGTGGGNATFVTLNGLKAYVQSGSSSQNFFHEYDIGEAASINYNSYSPALTNSSNGQINSSSWLDINSMTADETKNDGDVFYAVSTDNRTSWGVAKASDGVRKIARNNSGTWQYNNHAGTTVSVGYDLSNASYTTISPLLAQSEGYEYMHFKPDGTKVWVGGPNQDTIYEYDLSTGFDLSTISYGRSFAFSTSSQSQGFFMKSDGTRAYISDYTGTIYQLDLSTAWDITTASYSSVTLSLGHYTKDIYIKSDGTKLYNVNQNNEMKQFNMSTPWDLSTATLDHTVTLADSFTYGSITFNSDGTILFIAHVNTSPAALRAVNSYSLSTAWDISSTLTLITNYDVFPQIGGHIASGIGFNTDGSKMYIIDAENTSTSPGRRILEYSTGGTNIVYATSETWVNGTNNNEHATLQQALTSQAFNRMNKAQLDAVADGYHFSQDSADTLDLMIAPYAASGTSPISDGVTINYDAEALIREAIPGTDYIAEFPNPTTLNITAVGAANLKIRAQ